MEKKDFRARPEFTSALTKKELIFTAAAMVLHLFVLPKLLVWLIEAEKLDENTGNFILYAVMTVYTLIFMGKFLRRDFDPLADRPINVLIEVAASYFAMMCFNLVIAWVLSLLGQTENPNNEAIMEMADINSGMTIAMAVFLAPIVEEVIFRGGIFGFIYRYSRIWAYVAATLVFGLYHIWGFALLDIRNLVYLIQYIPAGILLCRCYERTNTVWTPIAMHMLVNALSMEALKIAE